MHLSFLAKLARPIVSEMLFATLEIPSRLCLLPATACPAHADAYPASDFQPIDRLLVFPNRVVNAISRRSSELS